MRSKNRKKHRLARVRLRRGLLHLRPQLLRKLAHKRQDNQTSVAQTSVLAPQAHSLLYRQNNRPGPQLQRQSQSLSQATRLST